MAEIINFESKTGWNSLQDYEEDASPANQEMSDYAEGQIMNFDIEGRLRDVDRQLGQTALAAVFAEQDALAA